MLLLLPTWHLFPPDSDFKDSSRLMARVWEGTQQVFTGPSSGLSWDTNIFFSQFQGLEKERSLKFDIFQNALWADTEEKCYLISWVSLRLWSEYESKRSVFHFSEINTITSGTLLYTGVQFEDCDLTLSVNHRGEKK